MNRKKNKLRQLHAEIDKMKRDLIAKDKELERSKQILCEKDEELKRIKKIAMLSPQEVSSMANENSIEVLQQIAIENQLSPNVWSPSNRNAKDSKAILSHPFYQNLPQKHQDNFPYFVKSSSDLSSNKKSGNKENANDLVFKERLNIVDSFSNSRQPKIVSKRYNTRHENGIDDSFQSLSSQGCHNDDAANCLNNQSESYVLRRDTHKVKMLEKNGLVNIDNREGVVKEITPIKDSKVSSINTTPNNNSSSSNNNGSYSSNYAKRKLANDSKSKNGRFIKAKYDDKWNTEERPRSVASKVHSNSNNSQSCNSSSKVVDLKEKRNKEKQKKIGLFGSDFSSVFTNGNICQVNRNYGLTAHKDRGNEELEPGNKTIAELYNINQNKFKVKEEKLHTQRSYTNLQYKNNQAENSTSEDMIKEVVIARREIPNSAKYNSGSRLTMQFVKQQSGKKFEDAQLRHEEIVKNNIGFGNNFNEEILQDGSNDNWPSKFVPTFLQKYQ